MINADGIVVSSASPASTSLISTSTSTSETTSAENATVDVDADQSSIMPAPINKGGRPKGSTNAKKKQEKIRMSEAISWICAQYLAKRQENNGKVPNGFRAQIGKEAIVKYQLPGETIDVPLSTIA